MGRTARIDRVESIRFDEGDHAYYLGDVRVPSITQMLNANGDINAVYFTEEARIRGSAVHALVASHALGALGRDEYEGPYRGYYLAAVDALAILRPKIHAVEEPNIHRAHRYGGRIDLDWELFGARGPCELKTGAKEKWHGTQTALQAILIEQETGIPATSLQRHALYLRKDGRYALHDFKPTLVSDFGAARNLIASWAGRLQPWEPIEAW
jgi:hypothetical protein